MFHIRNGLVAGALASAAVLAVSAAEAATESVVYSFCSQASCADGMGAWAGLMNVGGTLFGTTIYGGASGNGTVYAIDPTTDTETVVYSFGSSSSDGVWPYGGLIKSGSFLYGTTQQGGAAGYGTVFSIKLATGAESNLYSFQGSPDGAIIGAGLDAHGGILYGTAVNGGTSGGYGAVFSVDRKTGAETVLYTFQGGADGAYPFAGLHSWGGLGNALYGTTNQGGANGAGVVFSVDPATGAETVLYPFCSQPKCADGSAPAGGLTKIHKTLYGTTSSGGAYHSGTVYSLNPATGAETVLYSFTGGADGGLPNADLIVIGDTLYSTTFQGGVSGQGTVFSFDTTTGVETVLYSFQGGADGAGPVDGLLEFNGSLYGTTYEGGAGGAGTVFKVTP